MDDVADSKDLGGGAPRAKKSKSGEKKKKSSKRSASRFDQPYDGPQTPQPEGESKSSKVPSLGLSQAEDIPTPSSNSPRPRTRGSSDKIPIDPARSSGTTSPRRQSISIKESASASMAPITPRVKKELVKVEAPKPAPAPVPIPIPVPKKQSKASKKKEEDDYDDDFEDYHDDDFEEFDDDDNAKGSSSAISKDSPPKVSPATRIKLLTGSKRSDTEVAELYSPRTEEKSSKKTTSNIVTGGAVSKRGKKFASMNLSTTGNASADPRAKRLYKLREMNIFDMQVEQFHNQFSLVPGTPYELYLRMLRVPNSSMKQMGVPVNEETCCKEMQTEEIITIDKQIQYCYGDDTTLLNMMNLVKKRKENRKETEKEPADTLLEELVSTHGMLSNTVSTQINESDANTNSNSSSLHFTTFLQKSSQLCVHLLEEKRIAFNDRNLRSKSQIEQIMSPEHDWEYLAEEIADGANQCLGSRRAVSVRFSLIQPHVLITAHPFPEEAGDDLKPFMGLYGIWDVAVPAAPTWILSGRGQPTCCCMSGAQAYIAMAGTAEGVVHLWDMRESASIHQDRDALDLMIMKGIRKPCYSTPCAAASGRDIDTTGQHCHPIVQVEPVGSSTSEWASVVSQFASIDQSGLTILWMTAQDSITHKEGGLESKIDYGISPWSTLKLVRNRMLTLFEEQIPQNIFKGTPSAYQYVPIFATIPNDRSTYLLSSGDGKVGKLMRYGEAPHPKYFFDPITGSVEVECEESFASSLNRSNSNKNNNLLSLKSDAYNSDVTSISVSRNNSDIYYILVGRRTGVIDLFQSDESAPIISWNLAGYEKTGGKQKNQKGDVKSLTVMVSLVRWLPQTISSFLAIDEYGECYYFNLLKNPLNPTMQSNIDIDHIESYHTVDISECRPGSTTVFIVAITEGIDTQEQAIKIRRIWAGLVTPNMSKSEKQEEEELREKLSSVSARSVTEQIVQVFTPLSPSHRK